MFGRTRLELLAFLEKRLNGGSDPCLMMTPNPEQIVISRNNPTFLDHLQSADVLIPDGSGLVWASRWIGLWRRMQPVMERITGVDVMKDLLLMAQKRDESVLIIGGRDFEGESTDFANGSVSKLSVEQFSVLRGSADSKNSDNSDNGLNIFWTPGFADVNHPRSAEVENLKQALRQLKPTIVFVAFGAPAQEAWLIEWKAELAEVGVKIGMVVGGAPDILLGKISRAPRTFQQLGLEWLYRLWQQPWRWRRQMRLLHFIWLALRAPF